MVEPPRHRQGYLPDQNSLHYEWLCSLSSGIVRSDIPIVCAAHRWPDRLSMRCDSPTSFDRFRMPEARSRPYFFLAHAWLGILATLFSQVAPRPSRGKE